MPWSPNSYLVGVPSQMETAVLPSVPWQGPCHGSFTPGLVKAGFLERVRGTGLVGGGGGGSWARMACPSGKSGAGGEEGRA